MTTAAAFALALAFSSSAAAQAGDAPPSPEPAPVSPAPVSPKGDAPEDGTEDDRKTKPKDPNAPGAPKPDAVAGGEEEWSMVTALGATGCVVGGLVPGLGGAAGLTLFYGGVATSNCGAAGVILGIPGFILAVPSLLAMAPCAAGGTACGAAIGAVMDSEDPATAAAWTIPGLVIGTLGGGLATAGLFVTNPNEPAAFAAGSTMIAVGSLLALAGGPLAIAGSTLTRTPVVDDGTGGDKKLDENGTAVDVAFTSPTPSAPSGFMQF